MNTCFRRATYATFLAAALGLANPLTAQQPSGSSIVIIDVAQVFKEHIRLSQAMNILGEEVKAYDNYLREQQKALKELFEQRENFKAGTPEYKELDAKITRRQSDLQVEMQLKKKSFMEREAKHFYNTYTEVTQAVAKFADARGIRLVLRFNGAPMVRDDRASVLQGVNNDIVYHKDLDVTKVIIAELNKGSVRTPVGNRNNGNQIPPFGTRR